jgi:hypothetical protein
MAGCSDCTITSGTIACSACFPGYTKNANNVCINCTGTTTGVTTTGVLDPNAKSCSESNGTVTLNECKDGYFKYPATGTNKCYPCSQAFNLGGTAVTDTNSLTCSV